MTAEPGDLGPWMEQAEKLVNDWWSGGDTEQDRFSKRLLVRGVALALKGASDEQRERDCKAIREACGMCDGAGAERVLRTGHGCDGTDADCNRRCPVEIEDFEECEYCGRPIAAIRGATRPTEEGK